MLDSKTAMSGGKVPAEVDVTEMVVGKSGAAAQQMKLGDISGGNLKVWRVEDFQLKEWPEENYGLFFAGDSYVIHYAYQGRSGGEQHLVYFWQGRDSSIDEKGAAAALAAKIDEDLGGVAVQIRVVQNKEPNHFFQLFQGGMIVQLGGYGNEPEGREGPDGVALYQIKATNEYDVHAVQVTTAASSLNSGDCFVVVDTAAATVWEGSMCSSDEKELATKISKRLAGSKNVNIVHEGDEMDQFWNSLGGKGEYPKMGDLGPPESQPRLFLITDSKTGGSGVHVEEIFEFDQEDLCEDDIMMLDTMKEIFLWVGKDAREQEKTAAIELARKYIAEGSKVNGRDTDAPITYVESGSEPPIFTAHFLGWDDTKEPDFIDPYQEKLKRLQREQSSSEDLIFAKKAEDLAKHFVDPLEKKGGGEPEAPKAPKSAPNETKETKEVVLKYKPLIDFLPYEQLKSMRGEDGIDPTCKEDYLNEEEFKSVFKKTRDEYNAMPRWRQTMSKKEVGLF